MLDKSKYLSEKEQKQLLAFHNGMRKTGSKRSIQRWLLITTALNSGLRASELCDLKPSDLDLGSEFPSIKVCTKKGGENHPVVISQRLAKDLKWYLKNHCNGNKYLFTTETGKQQSPAGLWYIWSNALRGAGLQHYKLHASRHSFITNVYQKSKCIRTAQLQARHKSLSSTQIYAHIQVSDIAKTMNSI